jgi:membrane protein involved in colicin uptake
MLFYCCKRVKEIHMNDNPAWAAPPSAGQTVTDPTTGEVLVDDGQAAAQKKADKEAKKAAKDAEKAAAAEAKEAAKAAKAQEKADKQKQKEAAMLARNEAKAAKAAQREQAKQPEQNGVRRPKPDGECGKAWALFDQLSQAKGAPVAAAEIRAAMPQHSHLNEGNVKAEYPRWKKFHGLSGTIAPTAPLAPPAQPQPAA